jgi:hypothetical protein
MAVRLYNDLLTASINDKGVLDVDVVKGCTLGMAASKPNGCYDACYAATIAKFRGIDFTQSVTRRVVGGAHADSILKAVKSAPLGFFRIGTMGDPCHAWEATCELIEWLSPYAVPVIVTKHWMKASDRQLARLVECGAIINTSISALDTPAQLLHRERQMARYVALGGNSVARVVSCDFNCDDPLGAKLAAIQDRLLSLSPMIDNPLRVPRTHPLVRAGVIRLTVVWDLNSSRTVSLVNKDTYLGHCDRCPDMCGMTIGTQSISRPAPPQADLFIQKI